MDYKVISLDQERFKQKSIELRSLVQDSGFIPDAVIAVPRGGVFMQKVAWTDYPINSIRLSNHPSGTFKNKVSKLLKGLPLFLRDKLRIWDAKRLMKRRTHMDDVEVEFPNLPDEVKQVLIIDDAVDSGATLQAIIKKFCSTYPNKTFRSAALTVTSEHPLIVPDYFLYYNNTLLRMPWSADA